MTRERTRYRLRLFGAAAMSLAAVAATAAPASALTLQVLKTQKCVVANSANIGGTVGGASTNGYTIHSRVNSITGVLDINTTAVTPPMDLPPNGVICVSSITCSSSGVLKFNKNNDNTPVYLLVEGDVTLSAGCDIDVSGTDYQVRYGIGMDRVGGVGGPGGSDGGSCDFTFSSPFRAGEGIGPGGGGASTTGSAGGGASAVSVGQTGKNGTNPGLGGQSYSLREHRIMHGGSGGGCGSTSSGTSPEGGGGGGGVLVLAAGGTITFNHGSSYLIARGGAGGTYGGGGGGGVVRLVATKIYSGPSPTGAYGYVDVTRGGTCEGSYGGCGGDGLIKIESPDASGSWIGNSIPQTALYYGTVQEIFPDPALRPTLTIASVTATFAGVTKTVTRQLQDPSVHIHTVPGVFLETPSTPSEQVVTVTLTSNNVPHTAPVKVRLNTVYDVQVKRSLVVNATTAGTGTGALTWTASITVPGGLELGTLEAWVQNVCTPGTAGCP